MWRRLLPWLGTSDRDPRPPRQVAIAMLLLECARADFDQAPAELSVVREALRGHVPLSDAELDALIGDAARSAAGAVSLHGPLSRLNAEMGVQDKRDLVAWLWRVAAADGRIDPHEEHLLRRLADLLHVPHADYIRAKLAAQEPT